MELTQNFSIPVDRKNEDDATHVVATADEFDVISEAL